MFRIWPDERGNQAEMRKAFAVCRAAAVCLAMMVAAVVSHAQADDGVVTIVVLGDSLVAGYELAQGDAFPPQLEAVLVERGHKVKVINAGVSGDTATGALSRLDWAVPESADLVIVELGANDALRGVPPEKTAEALGQIITKLKSRDIAVLLAGMMAPPNMGPDYGARFNAIYGNLAKTHDVPLYPFFLDGVAADPNLNLADGMHPNPQGVREIVRRIRPTVEALVIELAHESGG